MNLVYFSNEYPRGELQDTFRRLHNLSKDPAQICLHHFLRQANEAVKDEIKRLPTEEKDCVPPFEDLLRWGDEPEFREGPLCGAIEGTLLVLLQMATLIGYLSANPEQLKDLQTAALTALGTGLLTAAGLATSATLADLPGAGADAVRLAFRLGVHVKRVSNNLESYAEDPDTWAYVVHKVDPALAQETLDDFNHKTQASVPNYLFLSAFSPTSITVSGPPARLRSLFNRSELFRTSQYIPLPVYGGLCHAPHVYDLRDIASVVHGPTALNVPSSPVNSIWSPSTGSPYGVATATDLWENVICELLTKAITFDRVVEGVVKKAQEDSQQDLTGVAYCFGNSIPLNDMITALSAGSGSKLPTVDLMSWLAKSSIDSSASHSLGPSQCKLAIVGMSCRLPGGATDNEGFWKILEEGLDVSRRIPADRFDIDSHHDPTGKQLNKTKTAYGCFLDEPGAFDASFFQMSPREAEVVDPQMRLMLVTAYEALEMSGYAGTGRTPSTASERIGTYYGQSADDYREVNQGQKVGTYYIPGGCRAFGPGRINYFFKFAGPSYSIDTACSSGLAAIEVACKAIWNGDVDTVLTGGVNVLTNPDGFTGLSQGHFLTTGHNACKTWDATADGYCRAEGIVSLVIKRLADAEADNDNVLGVILGAGTNHSAEAVSITHPHAGHQEYLAREVLHQAGVDPIDISYVELHGTGTQAGDHEEVQGILNVYAPNIKKRRKKDQTLHIGAVKANVGHGESVAGATALAKLLLMLQKESIPRHIGIKTEINPRLPTDFDQRNVHIPFSMMPWPRVEGKKRLAAINNFGAAGGNTTMILEEAPFRSATTDLDPRGSHVVTVSAKSKTSLRGNIERLLSYIDNPSNAEMRLADLAYTTTARRYQHTNRVAVTGASIPQIRKKLVSLLDGDHIENIKPVAKQQSPSIVFAFTGQGASLKSSNLELYRDSQVFRDQIAQLDRMAQSQGFESFIPAIDGSHPADYTGHSPVVTQLALVCTEIALARYWSSLGVNPDAVIGHSLGEYAAMHIGGVLSANDTIYLVGKRAMLLQEKCQVGSHVMMAVRADREQIKQAANGESYEVACVNGPSDTVLSGTQSEMDKLAEILGAAGYRCIKLDVAFAFHSAQTDPILNDFEALAKSSVIFREPTMPIISPLLGRVVFDGKTLNAEYLRRSTRETVDFLSALRNAQSMSTVDDETTWLEIGPHSVCVGFIKSTFAPEKPLTIASMRRGEDNWATVSDGLAAMHLAGVTIDWNEFHRPFEREDRLRLLNLPTYAWNEKNYWLQYNGDWCLTKGNDFYATSKPAALDQQSGNVSSFRTSLVQNIIDEEFTDFTGSVVMRSDLMEPDFLAAAHGHRMNNCGVVTSSIHADISYTLATYIYKKLHPGAKDAPLMNVTNMAVTKGLVARSNTNLPQIIQVTAETQGAWQNGVTLTWQNVDENNDNEVSEPFATATVNYEDSSMALRSWSSLAHLVLDRMETLDRLALEGKANRLSRNMAYNLFGSNLVNYADKYRGMQSVVINDLEGYADVQLTTQQTSGTWTVPPYFIDSVAHLAGFIMNCSDAMDTQKNYCVTPGWKSMRFAKPLVAGGRYRSYVRMIQREGGGYFGDVYIFQGDEIMGMVGDIEFHSYPRILLDRFFSPPDKASTSHRAPVRSVIPPTPSLTSSASSESLRESPTPPSAKTQATSKLPTNMPNATPAPPKQKAQPAVAVAVVAPVPQGGVTSKAIQLIIDETGLDSSALRDDVSFMDVGIDSLMSLVVSEKLKSELDVKVNGSLFLDYPTIGDLRAWLEEQYD
nr:BTG4 [Cercospora sp. JNU001]